MKVFAAVFAWRDNIARVEDESTRYVLPNHMMFEIAAQMPSEPATLLSCCTPVPPLIRAHANDLISILTLVYFVTSLCCPIFKFDSTVELIKNTREQHQSQPQTQPPAATITGESPPIPRPTYFANPSYPQSLSTTPPTKDAPALTQPTKTFSTPIANGYNTHNNTPSPVLTTEQLYKTAGWLHEDEPDQESVSHNLSPLFHLFILYS